MRRAKRAAISASVAAIALAACGGGTPATTAGPVGASAAATPPSSVTVTQTSDQTATYPLAAGQYKLAWTMDNCPAVDIVLTQTDGNFSVEKKSAAKNISAIIAKVPAGTYKLEQKGPSCTTFKVNLDRIGN